MASRLPTEIYAMIIQCVVNDRHGKSPKEMRALCEKHLYTHPASQRLSVGIKAQWLLCFSLAVEPRRAYAVRSLKCKFWPEYYDHQAWVETLGLSPNLTHLELVWLDEPPEDFREQMGNLLSACPRVTEFKFQACWGRSSGDEPSTETAQQFTKFAKQLRRLQVLSSFEWLKDMILPYKYPNLESFTVNGGNERHRERDIFRPLSTQMPSLKTLNIEGAEDVSLQDLRDGCKVWGKTLRSFYINHFPVENRRDGILSHLLPHLTALEELVVGPHSDLPLSDIQAIAKPVTPRLKAFRWVVDDGIFGNDPLANPVNVNKATIDIFNAHASTLHTFIIEESFDFWNFGMDIFQHLHKAEGLKNLRVQLHDRPTEEEIGCLLRACPKLGESETGLMVVKEFLTECTLATMKYKEDNMEESESSWGHVPQPIGVVKWSQTYSKLSSNCLADLSLTNSLIPNSIAT
ncbi:uncharacterized protein BKA55DRAFT_522449 [Fusarium redolens]|uniref:F-box domain-containing protein n=1 Tax=Fusarium redolens TaxID=48865 RepID=A0A9P9G9I4_FUSRE|nr:uncharacterized protein BKA55DRAFT_522449 [Fusarium redolens]KAH7234683.1 hypothetical protein BKA55DRAFT_522449 [Fusarium redolens]